MRYVPALPLPDVLKQYMLFSEESLTDVEVALNGDKSGSGSPSEHDESDEQGDSDDDDSDGELSDSDGT